MFSTFTDFSETHWDEQNRIRTFYTRFRDRVVSLSYDEKYDCYIVCLNNPNYDPTTELDSPVWNYTSWDATLLLDTCTDNHEAAFKAANDYAEMKNTPTIHPEYLPTSNI